MQMNEEELMIDTRALAQEVQDQLLAVVHRSQEQLRKSQDQVRKSQDQLRKSREAVVDAIRTGNQRARAVRPEILTLDTLGDPAKLRASAQELADRALASQRHLADRALARQRHFANQAVKRQRRFADQAVTRQRHFADQVVATQRQLAGKALQSASPVVAEQVAKLSHVVGGLPGIRRARPSPNRHPGT